MSIHTWLNEFYEVEAVDMVAATDEEACAHSLKKWTGLRKSNLKKHHVYLQGGVVGDENDSHLPPMSGSSLFIDSESCALCQKYLYGVSAQGCPTCPLAIVRGGTPCDKKMSQEKNDPYRAGMNDNNPGPMIRWLGKALAWSKDKAASAKKTKKRAAKKR